MRTKTLLSAVAVLAASLAVSKAQVYSQNVVGYVNTTLTGNSKYTCINNPLNAPTNTIGALLAGVPAGGQVLKYSPALSDYVAYTRISFGAGWSPSSGATDTLAPGEGCLVLMPVGSANTNLTFVGEVLQGTLTNHFAGGYKLVGNMVPDAGAVTALNLVPASGSQLLKWNIGTQDWDVSTKIAFGAGWTPSVPTLNVGEGFMLNSSGAYDWTRSFTVN